MGRIVYGAVGQSFDVDDRALAHLRVVLMNKLRRAEPFFLHLSDPTGMRSVWIHPSVPIVLHFFGSRTPSLNRLWVEELMHGASGPNGLTLGPEPAASASRAVEVDGRGHGVEESGDPLGL